MLYFLSILLLNFVNVEGKIFHIGPNNLYSILVPESTKVKITKNKDEGDVEHLLISKEGKPKFVINLSFERSDTLLLTSYNELKVKISKQNNCIVEKIEFWKNNNFSSTKLYLKDVKNDSLLFSGHYYLIPGNNKLITLNIIVLFIDGSSEIIEDAEKIIETLVINF